MGSDELFKKRRSERKEREHDKPSEFDPGTTVYELVGDLMKSL